MTKQKHRKASAATRLKKKPVTARSKATTVRARGAAARRKPVGEAAAAPVQAGPPAQPPPEPFFLKLDASCTLRESADLQFSLVAATGDPLVVDGSAVERVDTAGLQLLVALARRQQGAGRLLKWDAASPTLLQCGRRLGLIESLGLGELAAGAAP